MKSLRAEKELPQAVPAEWQAIIQKLQNWQKNGPNAHVDIEFEAALERFSNETYGNFLSGVERYRASPVRRDVKAPPTIWRDGTTRILDFGLKKGGVGEKETALIIPSLVNRYHILDLEKDNSFVRMLAAKNIRPLLIDWGAPGADEKDFTLDDYFKKRLLPILEWVARENAKPVTLVGYCMGGLLAAALAQLAPDLIKKLVFLATPWDFHAEDPYLPVRTAGMLALIEPQLEVFGVMPVEMLQSLFVLQQPFLVHDKFVRFAQEERPEAERLFVLVEDWLNDGVPLAKHVARTCLREWYIENLTVKGAWQVMGQNVAPENLRHPSLHVIPTRDSIVPQKSALALAGVMKAAKILQPQAGHISMMAHAAARDNLAGNIAEWLVSKN